MEALWNLEDKWKLTTQQALVLLTIVSFATISIGVATFLKKKKNNNNNKVISSQASSEGSETEWREPSCGLEAAVKRVLMGSLRWSRAKKETRPQPLLAAEVGVVLAGRQSHNSESPVWQRPILMGEKCELPRFSGLILYDESGHLLSDSFQGPIQVKTAAVTRTTLKDLL